MVFNELEKYLEDRNHELSVSASADAMIYRAVKCTGKTDEAAEYTGFEIDLSKDDQKELKGVTIRIFYGDNPENRKKFIDEAKQIVCEKTFIHPNTIKCINVFSCKDIAYTIEYDPIRTYIRTGSTFTVRQKGMTLSGYIAGNDMNISDRVAFAFNAAISVLKALSYTGRFDIIKNISTMITPDRILVTDYNMHFYLRLLSLKSYCGYKSVQISNYWINEVINSDTPLDNAVMERNAAFSMTVIFFEIIKSVHPFNNLDYRRAKAENRIKKLSDDENNPIDKLLSNLWLWLDDDYKDQYTNSKFSAAGTAEKFFRTAKEMNIALSAENFNNVITGSYDRKEYVDFTPSEGETSLYPSPDEYERLKNISIREANESNRHIIIGEGSFCKVEILSEADGTEFVRKTYSISGNYGSIEYRKNIENARREIDCYYMLEEKEKEKGIVIAPRLFDVTIGQAVYDSRQVLEILDKAVNPPDGKSPVIITNFSICLEYGLKYECYMEWLRRQPDREIKKRNYFLASQELLRTTENLNNAGIIHSDIKPQNILVLMRGNRKNPSFHVVFMDFNISHKKRIVSENNTFITAETDSPVAWGRTSRSVKYYMNNNEVFVSTYGGTNGYCAPETCVQSSEIPDASAEKLDAYSVSAVIYELLNNHIPLYNIPCYVEIPNNISYDYRINYENVPPPSETKEIEELMAVYDIIKGGLKYDSSERKSTSDMLDQLNRQIKYMNISTINHSAEKTVPAKKGRKLSPTAFIIILLVGIAIVVVPFLMGLKSLAAFDLILDTAAAYISFSKEIFYFRDE